MHAMIVQQVVHVVDGDTFDLGNGMRIRLAGVDADEMSGRCHQACARHDGPAAKSYLERLVLRRTVSCEPLDRSYNRIVARCTVQGVNVACRLLRDGMAVKVERYWRRYNLPSCY